MKTLKSWMLTLECVGVMLLLMAIMSYIVMNFIPAPFDPNASFLKALFGFTVIFLEVRIATIYFNYFDKKFREFEPKAPKENL